jgi:hypothetical protein
MKLAARLLTAILVASSPLLGQEALNPDMLARCQEAGLPVEGLPLCRDVVAAVQLLQPELGLALAGGNPTLGTASPLGKKFRFIPRMHFGVRVNFTGAEIPDILNYPADPRQPLPSRSFTIASPQADLSIGLFNGFQLASTLDGFLAVELLGSLGVLMLSSGQGFQDNAPGYGLGARVGILRESFTAPGISVSGYYKRTGDIDYGKVADGDDAQIGLDLDVYSFRTGISKSFVSFGVVVTLGWDRYQSAVAYAVADGTGGMTVVASPEEPVDLASERWSAFADLSYVVLFVNIVAELGWQEGQPLSTSRGDELASGKLFGSLGLELTL